MTALAPKKVSQISNRRRTSLESSEQDSLFRALFDTVPVGIAHTDVDSGAWLRMNPALCEMLGYSRTELSLLTWRDITHPDDLDDDLREYQRIVSGESSSYKLIKRYIQKDGTPIWTRTSITLVDNDLAEPYLMAVAEDITTAVNHSTALQESEERYRSLVETSPDAIVVICNHMCVYANQAAANIFRATPQRLMMARTDQLIVKEHHPDVTQSVVESLESGLPVDLDGCWLQTLRGEPVSRSLQVSCGQVTYQGEPAMQLILRDVTEQKRNEARLKHQATHDELTRLWNRAYFLATVSELLRGRKTKKFNILLMDLDRFKEVNDTFGHQYGDMLLAALGRRIESELSDQKVVVSRLGGDEFALVVQDGDAEEVARRLLQCVSQNFQLDEHLVEVGASIGIVRVPDHGKDANEILRRADVAMYQAKHARSGYALYDQERDNPSPDRLRLVSDLRQAIAEGALEIHYQPKADIRSGVITSAEALVRWRHPILGRIGPNDFIPLAEQSGLISPLTEWVLNQALRQTREWLDSGRMVEVAVNLSSRSLYDSELVALVTGALDKWRVEPECLRLELTETAIMEDPEVALETLLRIHDMGVNLSIDDFGTGYSSLGYLTRLPVDEIKIDREFVTDMLAKPQNAVIVRSTVELGHSLGLQVVAEGVEDKSTWESLGLLGCDIGQGYFLGRPGPAASLTGKLPRIPKNRWSADRTEAAG